MLEALAKRVQFIVYDKSRKVPVHPEKLYNIDPNDSANWLTAEVATAWAKFLGEPYGIGVVLWKGCGLACVDIDHALQADGSWSPLAQELCGRFHGSYQEVSPGGSGIHILFSYRNEVPPHKKKNVALHVEFYDELRFIGISGTNARGDVLFDATELLPKLIADYFPPGAEMNADGWTTEPHASWDGPDDDDELIRRMCASKSAGAIFGQRASVADLWTNNIDRLAVAFPPSGEGKEYDGSSADQALANHLAFWTGGNCERMYALMLRSGLARPKWERTDYIRGTVAKAAAWQQTYYRQRDTDRPEIAPVIDTAAPVELVTTPVGITLPANEAPKPAPPLTAFGNVITAPGQRELFAGCVYVEDCERMVMPNGNVLKKTQFDNNAAYSGRTYVMSRDGTSPEGSAWECFVQSKLVEFPKVRGLYFDPRNAGGHIDEREGERWVNTWRELNIPAVEGDVSLFTEHLRKILPREDDALILLSFFAACVQYRGVKAAWAPFIQGVPGNGKSFFSTMMRYCLGRRYVRTIRAAQIDGQFNGAFYGTLLAYIEDVKIADGKESMWEALKPLITETSLEIEYKGVDAIDRDVCHNMILNSNHKDGLRKTADDRRICPLFTAQQTLEDLQRDGMDEPYFIRLFSWLYGGGQANILHYLQRFEIPDRYNFAKDARRAPRTTATDEAVAAGMGSAEQEIIEAVQTERPGFKGGWISANALNVLLHESGKAKFIARNKRREMLAALGYVIHPRLPDGRMSKPLTDGTRPALYIKRGHSAYAVTDLAIVGLLYENAQKPNN